MPSPARVLFNGKYNGLANRLIGLVAHKVYADLLGVPLFVHWRPGFDCDAQFHDLFVRPRIDCIGRKAFNELRSLPDTASMHDIVFLWFDEYYRLFMQDLVSWPEYTRRIACTLAELTPSAAIQKAVDSFCGAQSIDVAMHLRLTDNVTFFRAYWPQFAARLPNLTWVSNCIDRWIDKSRKNRLFLATDNRRMETALKAKYGDALVVFPKVWRSGFRFVPRRDARFWLMFRRIRTTDIATAVIELAILAQSNTLIGTHASTFSAFAGLWGRKKRVLEIGEDADAACEPVMKLQA